MGELADVPIEPDEQTRLLDACSESVNGVIGGGVPGGESSSPSFQSIASTNFATHQLEATTRYGFWCFLQRGYKASLARAKKAFESSG